MAALAILHVSEDREKVTIEDAPPSLLQMKPRVLGLDRAYEFVAKFIEEEDAIAGNKRSIRFFDAQVTDRAELIQFAVVNQTICSNSISFVTKRDIAFGNNLFIGVVINQFISLQVSRGVFLNLNIEKSVFCRGRR